MTGMRKWKNGGVNLLLCLAVSLAFTACSATRRVSTTVTTPAASWVGCSTTEILEVMGNPDRIESEHNGSSVLVYESSPDGNDPGFDIFDPQASAKVQQYARFYLTREGECSHVDTNRDLPYSSRGGGSYAEKDSGWDFFFDVVVIPLFVLSIFL